MAGCRSSRFHIFPTTLGLAALALGLLIAVALLGPAPTAHTAFPGFNGDLVIESDRDGITQLFRIDNSGGNPMKLTSTGLNYEGVWSPDGTRIAFTSERDGNREIYVMNADGSQQTNLTMDPGVDFSPAWSADGAKIAF